MVSIAEPWAGLVQSGDEQSRGLIVFRAAMIAEPWGDCVHRGDDRRAVD